MILKKKNIKKFVPSHLETTDNQWEISQYMERDGEESNQAFREEEEEAIWSLV